MLGTMGNQEDVNSLNADGKSVVVPAFSTPCKPDPEVYYGVFVPDAIEFTGEEELEKVYTEKTKCLAALKKFRSSRFKSFSTFEEALCFAENGPSISFAHNSTGSEDNRNSNFNVEKPSPYRGPKSQDLVKFRKAIEKDDESYFDQCIDENPRYLVSSGDTPAILQEGSRYNALHVACRTDRPKFVAKVLSTVACPEFFQKLYPDDTYESSERRSRYLLDAYLNTPDKGLNETPLHFASKHGSLGCIRILTSYPDCSKTRRNKFSQTAVEIVGTRTKNASKTVMDEICRLLGDHYYVPLLRDDGLCVLPQVGEPWSPKQDSPGFVTEEQQLLACLSPGSSDSPLSPITPTLKVRGYAGPMSPSQAESFYRRWREVGVLSPNRSSRGRSASLRITDHEKGLERVGRELASSSGYSWSEYWDFLGEFTDISSNEGMLKLEKHLKQKFKQMTAERDELDASALQEKLSNVSELQSSSVHSPQIEDKDKSKSINLEDSDLSRASLSTMGELCQELEALRLNASLSPQLDSSGQPFISASSKFLQSWRDREKVESSGEGTIDKSKYEDSDFQYLSYITKSIHVSASRLAEVLGDLASEIQSSKVTNLSLGKALKTKLKPEIMCLRNVVSKCFSRDLTRETDCGFIHILLAFKAVEFVQQNSSPSDVCILAETFRVVTSNLNLVALNSSDEEDVVNEPVNRKEKQNSAKHVSCVLRALEKALSIAYNNCSSDMSLDNNGNSLRMHLLQLGDCTCCWDLFEEKYSKTDIKETPATERKYDKAFSFLHDTLFSENRNKEINQNQINYNKNQETIVRQLLFEEDGEKVIKATLTLGNGPLDRVEDTGKEATEKDDNDNDSFATAPSSVEDNMLTPEEGLKVFINGPEACKVDADVLTAVEMKGDIDWERYPHISQWLYLVNSYSEEERIRWTTPSHVQLRSRPSSMPRLLNTSVISTPPRHLRSWIPSSAPRVLFSRQQDSHRSSPS